MIEQELQEKRALADNTMDNKQYQLDAAAMYQRLDDTDAALKYYLKAHVIDPEDMSLQETICESLGEFKYMGIKAYVCEGIINKVPWLIHKFTRLPMSFIPKGEFKMGYKGGSPEEPWPEHKVVTHPFLMSQCVLTEGVMGLTNRKLGWSSAYNSAKGNKYPKLNIAWDEQLGFCVKTGLWMPTEAQWEWACTGGLEGRFFWGNDGRKVKKYCKAQYRNQEVYTVEPNIFGLYGMVGGVWQSCVDTVPSAKDVEERLLIEPPVVDPVNFKDVAEPKNHVCRGSVYKGKSSDCQVKVRGAVGRTHIRINSEPRLDPSNYTTVRPVFNFPIFRTSLEESNRLYAGVKN